MKTFIKVLTWLMIILLLAFVMAIAGVKIFGITPYVVASNSMQPAMPAGSMAYTVEDFNLANGDVVTWAPSKDSEGHVVRVTHRIVDINTANNTVTTKGDANAQPDANPVPIKDIDGKVVFTVPVLGSIAEFIHTKPGIFACLAYLVVLLVLIFLPSLLSKIDEKEEAKAQANATGNNEDNNSKSQAAATAVAGAAAGAAVAGAAATVTESVAEDGDATNSGSVQDAATSAPTENNTQPAKDERDFIFEDELEPEEPATPSDSSASAKKN